MCRRKRRGPEGRGGMPWPNLCRKYLSEYFSGLFILYVPAWPALYDKFLGNFGWSLALMGVKFVVMLCWNGDVIIGSYGGGLGWSREILLQLFPFYFQKIVLFHPYSVSRVCGTCRPEKQRTHEILCCDSDNCNGAQARAGGMVLTLIAMIVSKGFSCILS